MLISLLRLALQNRDVSEQQIAKRPQHMFADPRRIPVGDNPHQQPPFAQIFGAALFPAAAL
jgi:hypothetical protein